MASGTPFLPSVADVLALDERHPAEVRSPRSCPIRRPRAARPAVQQIVRRPARLDPAHLQRFADAPVRSEVVQPADVRTDSGVVVTAGPFASLPATVEAILPDDRVKDAVRILDRPSCAEPGMADVQALWLAASRRNSPPPASALRAAVGAHALVVDGLNATYDY